MRIVVSTPRVSIANGYPQSTAEQAVRRRSSSGRSTPHLTVCIPTFKRPGLLFQCLEALQRQEHDGFTYSVVIVDNDHHESAKAVTSAWQKRSLFDIRYEVEPVQNIALARNRAVRCARGEFIAFIDDDEVPCREWLQNLYGACQRYRVDGVLGPVRPYFPPGAPLWLRRSGLCNRPSHQTGAELNHLQTRTGNVLFRRDIIDGYPEPFPPARGRCGGEDMAFFKMMMESGRRFVWCQEAPVCETVVPERWTLRYYTETYLRIGGLSGERARQSGVDKWRYFALSFMAVMTFAIASAIGVLAGKHILARYSVRLVYHMGRIAGCIGFVPIRVRREHRVEAESSVVDVQLSRVPVA